jgi:hypothetical protein
MWNRAGKSAKRREKPTEERPVHRSRLSVLLFVLPLAATAACGQRDVSITAEPARRALEDATPIRPGAPPAPEQGLPRASSGVLPPGAADKVLPLGAQPLVKLLEPGAAPRADLSYALTKGSTQRMSMAMDMSMGLKAQGQALPQQALPRMTMVFDTAAAERNPAGEFRIDSRLSNVAVEPNGGQQEQMARALRPQVESMKGLGMAYWVSAKGNVRDVKLDMPASMPPAAQQLLSGMSQSFESMVTPLPVEPVGVGARWQVIMRTSSGGADLLQAAVYTLKSRDGSRAMLDVSLVQLSASDTIHGPQMPAGMSAKVKAFSSSGQGSTQVDLKSVAPEGGSLALKTSMTITVAGAGAAGEESTVETTTNVQIGRP